MISSTVSASAQTLSGRNVCKSSCRHQQPPSCQDLEKYEMYAEERKWVADTGCLNNRNMHPCSQSQKRGGMVICWDCMEQDATIIATLGKECSEWAPGASHNPHRGEQPRGWRHHFYRWIYYKKQVVSWAYSAKVNENSPATYLTLSSLATEINAITLAWLAEQNYTGVVFVSNSLSTLKKFTQKNMHADCTPQQKYHGLAVMTS